MIRSLLSPRSLLRWPWPALALVALGLVLLGVPEEHEGPTFFELPDNFLSPLPLNTGTARGFTEANAAAIAFLTLGGVLLLLGGWRHREAVLASLRGRPMAARLLTVQLAVGAALIVASGPSSVLRWWAPGTVLALLALLGLALIVWDALVLQPAPER